MKTLDKIFTIAGLGSLAIWIGVSSCDINNTQKEALTDRQVEAALTNNQWQVSYSSNKKNETAHFDGYNFKFNQDGSILAKQHIGARKGVWSSFPSSNGKVKVILDFKAVDQFDELNEDWIVVEKTEDRITF